jgi:hypothetical protein
MQFWEAKLSFLSVCFTGGKKELDVMNDEDN